MCEMCSIAIVSGDVVLRGDIGQVENVHNSVIHQTVDINHSDGRTTNPLKLDTSLMEQQINSLKDACCSCQLVHCRFQVYKLFHHHHTTHN